MRLPGSERAFRLGAGQAGLARVASVLVAVIAASGCASAPEHAAAIARDAGFTRAVVRGAPFEHVVFVANRHGGPQNGVLHVYIEGDGRPYLDRWTAAADPTPRNPLMLRLMTIDPEPAVYLGRPCYFGLAIQPPCTPRDWTLDRFSVSPRTSPRVVSPSAQAR